MVIWRRLGFFALCSAALLAGRIVHAAERLKIDETFGAVDAWTVGFSRGAEGCLASTSYSDQTTAWIGVDGTDDSIYFALTNPNWQSIQEGKEYRVRIASVGGGRWHGDFFGTSRQTEKGIIASGLKERFVKDLIRSPGIAVYLGSALIAKLNLEGSPAAFSTMLECQAKRVPGAASKGSQTGRGVASSGTGFFVSSSGHILTNNHVVNGCSEIEVNQPGQSIPGTVIATDKTNDLAVIKTASPPSAVAGLRSDLRVGDNIAVYGFPLSDRLATTGNFTVGYVSALAGLGDDSSKIQISAPIQPGSSGGPVFDHYGNAVAVIVSTATAAIMANANGVAPQNINFAIKASIARSFLDANGIGADGQTQDKKIYEFADLAERAKLVTVKIFCKQ
jgi:serine protease Do